MACRCRNPSEISHSNYFIVKSEWARQPSPQPVQSAGTCGALTISGSWRDKSVHTQTCTLTALQDTGISAVSLPSPKRQFLAQCGASLRSSFILHREISYSTKSAVLNVRSYRKLKSLFEYFTPRIKNLVLSIICFICHSSYQPLGRMWYNFLIELLQNQREENASHPKLSMV